VSLPSGESQSDPAQMVKTHEVPLSPRQIQILTLVSQGETYSQIAATIGITERTVKYHMAEILDRLHLQNRAQVIAYAAHSGLVPHHRDEEI
jgi:two-component system NarL family response regulator